MSGSLSLSLSQRFDRNGRVLNGGKLSFFAANTTTPQNAYQDTALTLAHPNPITLDAYGNIPEFYLADGNIHFRLTDANGVVVLEAQNALVIGPSGGGGGGGSAVDPTAIFQTGDQIMILSSGARSGWVRMNNKTIGSATSGATERANSDTQALFVWLWTNISDSVAGVSGGRGASAAADFAANKAIRIPDARGRIFCCVDDAGNTAANNLAGVPFTFGNNITPSGYGGEATHTLSNAELPVVNQTWTSTNTYVPGSFSSRSDILTSAGTGATAGGSGLIGNGTTQFTVSLSNFTPSGTISGFGGGNAHNNTPLIMLATPYMKL